MHQQMLPDSLTYFESLPDSAYVRLKTICHLYGISPATIWRAVSQGRIPKPVKFTPRSSAWNVGELRASLSQLKGGDR